MQLRVRTSKGDEMLTINNLIEVAGVAYLIGPWGGQMYTLGVMA